MFWANDEIVTTLTLFVNGLPKPRPCAFEGTGGEQRRAGSWLKDVERVAMMQPQRMHSQSEQPPPWSEHEVENLIRLLEEGVPVTRICLLLDRSLDDVELKLKELAINPGNQTI